MSRINDPKYPELFLLAGVLCDNEYVERPDVIAIPFTKEYIQSLIIKMETAKRLKKQDDQFYSIEFFDYHAEWIKRSDTFATMTNLDGKSVQDALDNNPNDYQLVTAMPNIDDEEDREPVDVPTVVVTPEGIKWQAVLKYGTDVIYGENLSVETLTKILDLLG